MYNRRPIGKSRGRTVKVAAISRGNIAAAGMTYRRCRCQIGRFIGISATFTDQLSTANVSRSRAIGRLSAIHVARIVFHGVEYDPLSWLDPGIYLIRFISAAGTTGARCPAGRRDRLPRSA